MKMKMCIESDCTSESEDIDIDDPDSQIPCESFGFTAPNTQSNDTQLSNLAFNVPGSISTKTGRRPA